MPVTKSERNAKAREWRAKNDWAGYMREYTARNKERINEQRRKRRQEANYLAREKAWRATNRPKVLAYKKKDREARPDDYRRWKIEHQQRNPELYKQKHNDRDGVRRARIAGRPTERISHRAVYERDNMKCGICGRFVAWREFSLDHIVPISRGGAHINSNVRTSHLVCNIKRGNRGPAQPFLGPCS